MNTSDSERIRRILDKENFIETKEEKKADLIIIVACSIRQSAVNRIYGKIPFFNKYKKNNPKFKTIITGCMLAKDKKLFASKFDFVLNIKDIAKIPKLLGIEKGKDIDNDNYLKIQPKQISNFSAIVPIMTGCNNYCTYCVVPYVRGPKKSRSAEDILEEIQLLIKNDYKEVWLLGQNVNDYGVTYKNTKINFAKLLKKIDEEVSLSSKQIWIRFTSPHPKNFSDELIEVIATGKNITNYLNLPMQSGDNQILQKMNRGYTIEEYNSVAQKIRSKIPGVAVSTDLILGFTGEEEKHFQNTVKAVKNNEFDMIYINQYSVRKGTAAEKLGDTVTKEEKKRRWDILNQELGKISYNKNKKYLDKEVDVLIDNLVKDNYLGKTRDYKTVKIEREKGCRNLIGQFIKVKITEIQPFGLSGTLIKD
jgi:tRNA-2-methylthio-N6-dimethylallyladenosine synthase